LEKNRQLPDFNVEVEMSGRSFGLSFEQLCSPGDNKERKYS
jgi:hypothetical protein